VRRHAERMTEADAVVDLDEAAVRLDDLDDDDVVAVADDEAGGLVRVLAQRAQRRTRRAASDLEPLGGAHPELEHRQSRGGSGASRGRG
jgi:hypothetical protein